MTPEQQALINKDQRSIEAARGLLDQQFFDFAVSRAYYAMFYVAEVLLDAQGFSFSSHAGVISTFGQLLARPGIVPLELHRQLIDAQALRTRADYDISADLSSQDAQSLISQADNFLTIALQILSKGDRSSLPD
jgi:uncharacterized protein (UPF0332 family)